MVWGYIKSRETARRMDAYAGECQSMHPVFDYDSEARAHDLNLAGESKTLNHPRQETDTR